MIDLTVLRKRERIEFSDRAFSFLLSMRPGCESTIEVTEYAASVEGLADSAPHKSLFTLVRTKEGFAVYEEPAASGESTAALAERNALAPLANEKRVVP